MESSKPRILPLCPVPLSGHRHIVMEHGGGGKLSAELFEKLILPAFDNSILKQRSDAAIFSTKPGFLAMSTDSYVVRPLFFPGGSIGNLAINGTVNDLAMVGASPLYLSVGLILEEGLPIEDLATILFDMSYAAQLAKISIVTGDTKVIERNSGSGCLINTTGIGVISDTSSLSLNTVELGDAIIVSGTIADHGLAVLGKREGFTFQSDIQSDTASIAELVQLLLSSCKVKFLRDPTRGGIAETLNDIAIQIKLGITIFDDSIPIKPSVKKMCEILGLDPMTIANEGKFIAVVSQQHLKSAMQMLISHPLGRDARHIGNVVDAHHGIVSAVTPYGTNRIIQRPSGELLPRIC